MKKGLMLLLFLILITIKIFTKIQIINLNKKVNGQREKCQYKCFTGKDKTHPEVIKNQIKCEAILGCEDGFALKISEALNK